MNHWELLVLGLIAGGTIYIGLPLGRIRGLSNTIRSALSMLAAGILIYLLIEILGNAAGQTSASIQSAVSGNGSADAAVLLSILLIGGFFVGFSSLVAIQQKWISQAAELGAKRLSWMIAVGIGLHNLSEGLAIGQSYTMGRAALAIGLIVGFALHNATEGFGIVGPTVLEGHRVPWKTILLLGLVGGGPTFVGTLLGSLWTSPPLSVFVLAMAGGAILYVVKELFSAIRRETAQQFVMTALVFGFAIGWGTETITAVAQAGVNANAGQNVIREADGDVISTGATAAPQPRISKQDVVAQDQSADNLLHEKAMVPKILSDGTKEFDVTASTFPWQLYPGEAIQAWGYNGEVPGPLIRLKVGDKVAIVLKNELPQPTTLHLHGLAVPNNMDGVPDMPMPGMPDMTEGTQTPIKTGDSFTYRFTVTPQMIGTHLYHTHVNDDFQMDMGLHGVLIVDPATTSRQPHYDVDALYELASFKVGGSEGENVFTMNGKAYPETPALNVKKGQRVLIRLVNASAEETHVMHLHGYTFAIVARDGNPLSQPVYADTVTLGPSQTADIAFTANNPGQWMFHCHILDHTENPSAAGDGSATQMATMGGLMTFINVN